jgi:hypothetical protein
MIKPRRLPYRAWVRVLAGGLTILSAMLLAWAYWPPALQVAELVLDENPWHDDQAWQALRVRLESPRSLRPGEEGRVRLEVQPVGQAVNLAASPLLLVTRLDLPGMMVEPSGEISAVLSMHGKTKIKWKVLGQNTGNYEGAAWIYLGKQAQAESLDRLPVSAQEFPVRVAGWSWAPLPVARRAAVALVAGSILLWLGLLARWKRQ